MLLPLLVQAMEKTHAFKAVIPMPTTVPGLQLQIDEVQMRQDFSQTPSKGEVMLRAQLIDSDSDKVIAVKRFKAEAIAPSENAKGGVIAMNQALVQVLRELQNFVVKQTI